METLSTQQERWSTHVCIIGAGPAGLLLGLLLLQAKIPSVILERLSRDEVFSRSPHAGLLEDQTIELLRHSGVAERLLAQGQPNRCCEFRLEGKHFVFNYAQLCGGRSHWVYPQHELVADLMDAFVQRGGDLCFGVQATAIEQGEKAQVVCQNVMSGSQMVIDCEVVAGCDGSRGISRASVPSGAIQLFKRSYAYAWLALLAAVSPSSEHTIYALHSRGFAAHILRSSALTRFYLQVPKGSALEAWPEERIWSELRVRLARDNWGLKEGRIVGCSLLEVRSEVVEPMQYKRLFLVGDAAHLFPPAGGKGMNMALQDAQELARRLRMSVTTGEEAHLAGYSLARLAPTWQAQQFSNWMMETLNSNPGEQLENLYAQRIQLARLEQLYSHPAFALSFAERYVGILEE
jgi:p-hydroxybenzoate 3-monooxygenase